MPRGSQKRKKQQLFVSYLGVFFIKTSLLDSTWLSLTWAEPSPVMLPPRLFCSVKGKGTPPLTLPLFHQGTRQHTPAPHVSHMSTMRPVNQWAKLKSRPAPWLHNCSSKGNCFQQFPSSWVLLGATALPVPGTFRRHSQFWRPQRHHYCVVAITN